MSSDGIKQTEVCYGQYSAGCDKKKSFELNYNGGTIWCEHLDGMGTFEDEVTAKYNYLISERVIIIRYKRTVRYCSVF